MLRKSALIVLLSASCLTMSGCSSIWSSLGDFSYSMAEATNFPKLRGASEPETKMVETTVSSEPTIVNEVLEVSSTNTTLNFHENRSVEVTTSQHDCPDGTYLTADNSCMSLETDDFELPPIEPAPVVDTSPIPCPEGTYLAGANECRSLETETYDLTDVAPVSSAPSPVYETSPDVVLESVSDCPPGFQMVEGGVCMYLGAEAQIDDAFIASGGE